MSAKETNIMASLIASLSKSFKQVPPVTVPPMLDCILASSDLSPSSLFASLLEDFSNLAKDAPRDGEKSDSDGCNYILSWVRALCHLLKKHVDYHEAIQLFVYKCFIPLIKMGCACEGAVLNQIAESFLDAVVETNTWEILETNLVAFLLGAIHLSADILQNEKSNVFEWGRDSVSQSLNWQLNDLRIDNDNVLLSWSFPLPISCHILTLIMEVALQNLAAPTTELMVVNGDCYLETFAANLLWDLCNIAEQVLLQSLEHRSCTICFLLPIILKAFDCHMPLKVSVHGQSCKIFRNNFLIKIWKCCKTLFSLGNLERRDAYSVFSLYLSVFACTRGENTNLGNGEEQFDVRAEKAFWQEIKRGLVDDESSMRKQSLHILKAVLCVSEGRQGNLGFAEKKNHARNAVPHGMTKRELWADKEAKSLGVGKLCNSSASGLSSKQQWEAFLLLYEMLDEYGIHLVEAAWNHQATLLLQFSFSSDSFVRAIKGGSQQNQMEEFGEIFDWLSILWKRGFRHDNPQVRCIIMQSFVSIEWTNYGSRVKSVPEGFILGVLMEALNDPVHHRDFGMKGVYTSKVIEGAAWFFHQYTKYLNGRQQVAFLINLASVAKQLSFGRAGLMCLAECIASSACGVGTHSKNETRMADDNFPYNCQVESPAENDEHDNKTNLLDVFRFVIESSKQHFNPTYRLQVCQKLLEAASLMVRVCDVSLEVLLQFISAFPQEFTDYNGSLCVSLREWFSGCTRKHNNDIYENKACILKGLHEFPKRFVNHHYMVETFDDEDLHAWEFQTRRWARVLFLYIKEEQHLEPIFMFIKNHGLNICKENHHLESVPVKFLILMLSSVQEIQIIQEATAEFGVRNKNKSNIRLADKMAHSIICKKFTNVLFSILEELVSFAKFSCSIFHSSLAAENTILPNSIRGKLGGPSQRRLSTSITTAVLQAITSMKAVASISFLCAQIIPDIQLDFALRFMWKFILGTLSSSSFGSEIEAEVSLAAYEAFAPVLKLLLSPFSLQAVYLPWENFNSSLPAVEGKSCLESLVISFLKNVNNFLAIGLLARTRRAVLLSWKWLALECLLSIPCNAFRSGLHEDHGFFFSDDVLRSIFCDLVDSLENAGEGSVLPMLRSARLVLQLLSSGKSYSDGSPCSHVDAQMMWHLVRSSWILHISCNKRRVAPIAALLSSVLHSSVFNDGSMHETDNAVGPLKWFVEMLLDEGTRSPRTIRLAALHLSGLWLSNPSTIKFYIKELRLLTLYGSVAFDEDFEMELSDNYDAKTEVSLLAKSPDSELTEVFINTELYARVSVAALFYRLADLADMVGSTNENQSCLAALESGKSFLLELLDSVVHDKDLAKELYKKYSGIHRRKIRAWQMICVLSRFVRNDIVGQVTQNLHICLYKNNLPAVRQYLETFAISIYSKFPAFVGEQLVPILRDYDMRPQALSSYVFIAANVILHANQAFQLKHLEDLLPPIIPLLTSHHHSLRGFTQLLVHHVLCKLFPPLNSRASEIIPLEKQCFEDLKSYLAKNSDCKRLRLSMEGYLDAYNPNTSTTPARIFVNRVEEIEFECVPVSLMDHVLNFLKDVREDLRSSMAKDLVTIKNESLKIGEDPSCDELLSAVKKEEFVQQPEDTSLDFQKKISVLKHEKQDNFSSFFKNEEIYRQISEMEREDGLLNQLLQSRRTRMEKIRGSQQQFILVASLLDRIPNLAGLARTCEVFKASGLAVADANIVVDKQFQLISVTAEKWVPIIEVPVKSMKKFLWKKKREGFSILGLEQTANSIQLDQFTFPRKMVLVLGREKEGIPVDIIHILDACIEIPQLGVVRSLNVHVSGAIALWEYTRQQRLQ